MPKPSKYNELFSSDIFNQKEIPRAQPQRNQIIRNFRNNNTSNDIFPQTIEPNDNHQRLRKARSRDYLHSDIFFRESPNIKVNYPIRDNLTKSTVFSDCKSKDYKVKKDKTPSTYHIEDYYDFEEPNAMRHSKNFYTKNEKEEPFVPDCADGQILGYYESTENGRNNFSLDKIKYDPNKKRFPWNYPNSSGVKFITKTEEEKNPSKLRNFNKSTIDEKKARMNRLNELQSNIFNDPNKKKFNLNTISKERPITSEYPDPKKNKCIHTKWPKSKFYWLDTPTEILFKRNENKNEKESTPFSRKQKEFTNTINVLECYESSPKENNIYNPSSYISQTEGNNLRNVKPIKSNCLNKKGLKINVDDNKGDIDRIKTIVRDMDMELW